MNIFYLASCNIPSPAADSLQVMKMCSAFANLKNNITLFSANAEDNNCNIFKYYGVEPEFKIIRENKPKIKTFGVYLFSRKIKSRVKKNELPDLFYGRDFFSLYLNSDFGVPVVFESHMIPMSFYHKWVIGRLLKSPNLKCLIVTANQLKDEYKKIYPWLNPDKIIVAFNGANILKTDETIKLKGDNQKVKIGYVGHLYPGKGMELINKLALKSNDFEYHIIGGNEKDINYWKNKTRSDNIFYYGFIPNSKIGSYYQAFDILIAPYLDHRIKLRSFSVSKYPSPLKLIEYMSAGKPVVASDLPMSREVLRNNINSILCPVNNLDCWLDAFSKIASDSSFGEKISNNAYRQFLNRYTWSKRAEQILNEIIK